MTMQSAVVPHAQSRTLGAGGLALDDGHGHIITILAPTGMSGNYTYTLPTSPGSLITSGYVAMGSAMGQTLLWNGSYWTPSNFMSNTTSG
ncbi:MAG TPA: hypothetical protein VFX22_00365, partial [Candidatus Kapabacteria bacterium]|nr:hypothetical protein [Candidatus Kapabacteria bacterium]